MCPKFGHTMDTFWDSFLSLDMICEPEHKCPKCDQINDFWTLTFLRKSDPNLSIMCPKFGHILGTLWTFPCSLDIFCEAFYICPNRCQQFGCFSDMISNIGHILGIILAHFEVWSHFGQIMDTIGRFVSKMCLSLHRAGVPITGSKSP